MSRLQRVVFFSKHDGAASYMLEKAEKILESLPDFSALDLNSLLEFHHIHKYFENGLFLNRWTEEQKMAFLETVKLALSQIKSYFLNLKPEGIFAVVSQLEFDHRKSFWELFRFYETYKRTDKTIFLQIMAAHPEQSDA